MKLATYGTQYVSSFFDSNECDNISDRYRVEFAGK